MFWRLTLFLLMPLASLSAIYVGESTPYGRWEGGYFCDHYNCCWYYDPCQTYREFCYPCCTQREFSRIEPPCPKVWRGEQVYNENSWDFQERIPQTIPGYNPAPVPVYNPAPVPSYNPPSLPVLPPR